MQRDRVCRVNSKSILPARSMLSSVCVIGGGLAGIASAYFLTDKNTNITVIDRNAEPGMGTVEVGLLHPLTPKGRLIWEGRNGWNLTRKLIQDISTRGHCIVDTNGRIIRLFNCRSKFDNFVRASQHHSEVGTDSLHMMAPNVGVRSTLTFLTSINAAASLSS